MRSNRSEKFALLLALIAWLAYTMLIVALFRSMMREDDERDFDEYVEEYRDGNFRDGGIPWWVARISRRACGLYLVRQFEAS